VKRNFRKLVVLALLLVHVCSHAKEITIDAGRYTGFFGIGNTYFKSMVNIDLEPGEHRFWIGTSHGFTLIVDSDSNVRLGRDAIGRVLLIDNVVQFVTIPVAIGLTDDWELWRIKNVTLPATDKAVVDLVPGINYELQYHNPEKQQKIRLSVNNDGHITKHDVRELPPESPGIYRALKSMTAWGSIPKSEEILDCTWGNGQFIMVGRIGIITSANGTKWVRQNTGLWYENLEGVAWGNGRYVAVGDNGLILSSSDGVKWTVKHPVAAENHHLYGVAWVKDRYIATGDLGRVLISEDGENWRGVKSGTTKSLKGMAWGNGRFVITGDKGTILTSVDGNSWKTQRTDTLANIEQVVWTGDEFIAVGYTRYTGVILTSIDGITWASKENKGSNRSLFDIGVNDNKIVAVGADILTSEDGESWVYLNAPLGWSKEKRLNCVSTNKNLYLTGGGILSGIFTSTDGLIWQGGKLVTDEADKSKLSQPQKVISTDPHDKADNLKAFRIIKQLPDLDIVGAWQSEPILSQLGLIQTTYTFNADGSYSSKNNFMSFCEQKVGQNCEYFWEIDEGEYTIKNGVMILHAKTTTTVLLKKGESEPEIHNLVRTTRSEEYEAEHSFSEYRVELDAGNLSVTGMRGESEKRIFKPFVTTEQNGKAPMKAQILKHNGDTMKRDKNAP
jgi:hypothetical protein